jgi:hypothetical protein
MGDHDEGFTDTGSGDEGSDTEGGLVEALRKIGRGVPGSQAPVLGFGVTGGQPAPGAPGPGQLDLNDERNLGNLEDPVLVAHMRRARATFADHERIRADVPGEAALAERDAEARRALSGTSTSMNSGGMDLRCATDDVLVQATNLDRLVAGEALHGFPAANRPLPRDGPLAQNLTHMAKKLRQSGAALEKLATDLQNLERALTLARRGYEAVVDGLRRRCDDLAAKNGAGPPARDARAAQDESDGL